jgi:RNA polymerase sigma-70 factor (ECF subfamily)
MGVTGPSLRAGESRAGDLEGFESLIRPLLEPAFQLACLMLDDRHEAEDAVQESALKAWRNLRRLRDGERGARPWFFKIVSNTCRDVRRRRWRRWVSLDDSQAASGSDAESVERASDLSRALRRLGHEDRLLLLLRYYLDLPFEEVAAVLGVSSQAARSRNLRALARIRPALEIDSRQEER